MALVLEVRHSKSEILEAYLNEVYLGQEGALAIHGVGRAAEALFGKGGGMSAASEAEAYLVTSALRGAVERGTGRSLRAQEFSGIVAAKSGTTNGFCDGWFIGYTPSLAVAVWVGFDDGQSLGLPGSRVALPIFARFMASATGRHGDEGPWGTSGFEPPAGLELVEVDPETGLRAGPGCPGTPEIFIRGTAPWRSCSPYSFGMGRRVGRAQYEALRRLREVTTRRDQ